MKKNIATIVITSFIFVFGIENSVQVNGVRRSVQRLVNAILLTLAVLLASIGGVDAAAPERGEVQSVRIEQTAKGVAPSSCFTPAQARLMARRAAVAQAIREACATCGAPRGTLREVISESWDGETCTLTAWVQVFSR